MSFNNQYRPTGFGGLPVVTKNILIINVIMFIATMMARSRGIELSTLLGLHYYSAPDFKIFQFITYIFMHADMRHILFNMLAVYFFGQVLEQVWGPKRYLVFYIITGLGAALAQYMVIYFTSAELLNYVTLVQNDLSHETIKGFLESSEFNKGLTRDSYFDYKTFVTQYNAALAEGSPRALSLASQFLLEYKNAYLNAHVIVGASGSLFGILGAFAMLFPNTEILVYFVLPIKAKWLVIGYGIVELGLGWLNDPEDRTAHFAHLGGLFVGIILVLIWRRDRNHFY